MANPQQELVRLLEVASQGNQEAMGKIDHLCKQNFGQFALVLSQIFATNEIPVPIRQQAGLQLKNSLISKNDQQQQFLSQRWSSLQPDLRARIKTVVFQVLHSPEKRITDIAALVISRIASIDIPQRQWDQLVPALLNNIGNPQASVRLKESSLTTLGYVCEEVGRPLQGFSNKILTAISLGMKSDEPDHALRLAATFALKNCLGFVQKNFEDKNERTLIMRMVFASIAFPEVRVREVGFKCLVQIADTYYSLIGQFMEYITKLTMETLQKDEESVCFQAIELWSTIAEQEADLRAEEEEEEEEMEAGGAHEPSQKSLKITEHFAKVLVPALLPCLTKQSDEPGDDTWNVAKAAGSCLLLMAQAIGDAIVPLVFPFIRGNFNAAKWRMKDAAIVTFGLILDGPDPQKLAPIVSQAFLNLLNHLKDEHEQVQDSAAWAISRVCCMLPNILNPENLARLVDAICFGLQRIPPVAHKLCLAVFNLAEAQECLPNQRSVLSPHFKRLVNALLAATNRKDVSESSLLTAIYESVNILISKATSDSFEFIASLVPEFLKLLHNTIKNPGLTPQDQQHTADVQALICSTLQGIMQRLNRNQVLQHANNIVTLLLQCLQSKNPIVLEETLHALGTAAVLIGKDFINYMQVVQPILVQILQSPQETLLCTQAVGTVGDISRALGPAIRPMIRQLVQTFLRNLQDAQVASSLKPHIISCLGDLALAANPDDFVGYVQYILMYLEQAASIEFKVEDDDDEYDFQQQLWVSILSAYTGLIQGLRNDKGVQLIFGAVSKIFNFLTVISKAKNRENDVLHAAAGLAGDLAARFGRKIAVYYQDPSIHALIHAAMASEDPNIKADAEWAKSVIEGLTNQR